MAKLKFLAFKGYRRAGFEGQAIIIITEFCFLFSAGSCGATPLSGMLVRPYAAQVLKKTEPRRNGLCIRCRSRLTSLADHRYSC